MREWGLAVISIGGVLIMVSQLQENSLNLIVAGLAFVIGGIIMFRRGKSDKN